MPQSTYRLLTALFLATLLGACQGEAEDSQAPAQDSTATSPTDSPSLQGPGLPLNPGAENPNPGGPDANSPDVQRRQFRQLLTQVCIQDRQPPKFCGCMADTLIASLDAETRQAVFTAMTTRNTQLRPELEPKVRQAFAQAINACEEIRAGELQPPKERPLLPQPGN